MSQSSPTPVLVTEDLLPDLVGKLIVMVETEDKPGVDQDNEEKKESNENTIDATLKDKVAEETDQDAKIKEDILVVHINPGR